MKAITNALNKVIAAGLFAGMCVLIIVTFLQVLCRFVLKVPISWSEEVARLSFVWMILLGSGLAVREGTHLSLNVLSGSLPPAARGAFAIGVNVVIVAVAVLILVYGGSYVQRSIGKRMVTIPVPANCVYIAAPISAVVMILNALENIVDQAKGGKET